MLGFIGKTLKRGAIVLVIVAASLFGLRVYDIQRGPPLEPWHTFVPHELSIKELDRADWTGYLKAENDIFSAVRTEVTQKLPARDRVPVNRYFDGSAIHPAHFKQDWNRSFILEPDGEPVGVAVFLHGLTDSPYSLLHLARHYRDRGFLAIAIRLPGHGTVPAGLTEIDWEDWLAATRLAVREARARVGAPAPLHLVGYSNGGALAVMYALEALENKELARPDRVVLLSPMIGVTAFARFAGLAGLPAILPAFAKAAWLSVLPEFNPFKYNSFPVNGARQSHLLSTAVQRSVQRLARENRLADLAPILTFQSVVDFTVSTRAIVASLYAHLPANGSEFVLFDLNRATKLGPLLSPASETVVTRLLPPSTRNYRVSIITNANEDQREVVERVTEAGSVDEKVRELGLSYPPDVFSLSHIALPFPLTDSLYGLQPDPAEDFGIRLGAIAAHGERGTLIMDLDTLLRMSSNPFFPYVIDRVDQVIREPSKRAASTTR
ncbi:MULTISPECIES: alpha/beta hydrolase [unclassified Chelatococcus]|uniref:alpha/beta hydrolase n=1 Tax=unclassified Chelatococcus TaxID=2638111 RepID=UPI001BCD551C|nr:MULTISPECIES: alpha/beta hydrolase [unclassified Chelatococcus]CAH1671974.1 Membrane protein [Hyphomicrobiales bacterium]MBS7738532.1 alpha/beta hydrolase [Chelatococcus sp. HY11]MBX3542936.1 alpha/beta hydrolase [Chelatococcus sp.]MCO5076937.1 alpha/beta hydrolase [Chelatococcus sp.]CAH1675797.1 Membrane protein [Hyphomicrobiales bacterium]